MRIFLVFTILLIILSCMLKLTNGVDCHCDCCTTQNCNPTRIGSRPLWFCSEASTCTQAYCTAWYPDSCPPRGADGQTRSICGSYAQRLLPTLFTIISINLILFFAKDTF